MTPYTIVSASAHQPKSVGSKPPGKLSTKPALARPRTATPATSQGQTIRLSAITTTTDHASNSAEGTDDEQGHESARSQEVDATNDMQPVTEAHPKLPPRYAFF